MSVRTGEEGHFHSRCTTNPHQGHAWLLSVSVLTGDGAGCTLNRLSISQEMKVQVYLAPLGRKVKVYWDELAIKQIRQ